MRWYRRISQDDLRGQAMVETAIVAPLFVFMMLGLLQLTLVEQARSFVKYAAYRAARTGAMHNACKKKMTESALGALVPVIAMGDALLKAQDAAQYSLAWAKVKNNQYLGSLPIIKLTVCGPLRSWFTGQGTFRNGNEVDFDDPRNVDDTGDAPDPRGASQGGYLRAFERTKLKIQVRYHHRLIIPFANAIYFWSWLGQQVSPVLRMNGGGGGKYSFDIGKRTKINDSQMVTKLRAEAALHRFYFPLYGAYAFRMQSNLFLGDNDCKPPEKNECWHYDDGSQAGSP